MIEKIRKKLKQTTYAQVTILTGAGISAESGIPTFRGPEGIWTVGSINYTPQEMATNTMFSRNPEMVWQWYLYRFGKCISAEPNRGHYAIVDLQERLGDRFCLITQNIDNLHIRAGSDLKRSYQIHGNIRFMRCSLDCTIELFDLPQAVIDDHNRLDLLICPRCGGRSRPHVLWFDEMYNEHYYHYHSAMQRAAETDILVIIGSTGATTLPNVVTKLALQNQALIVNVDIEYNHFAEIAEYYGGYFLQGKSGELLDDLFSLL
ncbi:MAG: RNA polymerase subunit sigma [Calditrichaeota bacterium]|nr:RNA polymerase subunit sigma [Calditrichota bacterium]